MLGLASTYQVNAKKYLVEDECSILVQSSKDNRRLQGDGWGIAWYERGALRVHKSDRPVYEEKEKFIELSSSINSNLILAHVRKASNPLKLPLHMLRGLENVQPFCYENYSFIHNGTVNLVNQLMGQLEEFKKMVKGNNDSEVYFWYMIKRIIKDGIKVEDAFHDLEILLVRIWRSSLNRPDVPYKGLNAIMSDGKNLYAYCKYDEEVDKIDPICYKKGLYFDMRYLNLGNAVVIASEPTNDNDAWMSIGNGNVLIARVMDGNVELTFS